MKTENGGMFRSRGQALVEFALVLSILIAVLLAIVEFSRLMFVSSEVENAAREGAQYAALHPSVTAAYLKANVIDPRLTLATTSTVAVSVVPPASLPCQFCPISVNVTYTWHSFFQFIPGVPLQAKASKLIESFGT